MLISTIVLSWNRARLLEQTLRSYAATVSGPYEIIVVDNASTDQSREIIRQARDQLPTLKTILLDENLGGRAINLAFTEITGDLIHISENDQGFLAGWSEHVRGSFLCFDDLGQLSLHGVVPTDQEAWGIKLGRLRFARGKILYEAHGNVGTSSIIRSSLIREANIRVSNIPNDIANSPLFPDDGKLSSDIKQAGYWCAWSDRYYVRNLGHELDEFERDPEYYRSNYSAKVWLGLEGWQNRIAKARERSKVVRRSLIFPNEPIQPEKSPNPVGTKQSQFWSMFDGCTAETEVLDFVYTLVRLIKPANALETGTWLGRSAIAIALAMRDNGFGLLQTIEKNEEVAAIASRTIEKFGLTDLVQIHVGDSLAFVPDRSNYQFALFDSDISIRANEFSRFYDHLDAGAVVVFHDTADHHANSASNITALQKERLVEGLFFDTPRGLYVGKVTKPPIANTR